MSIQYNYPIKNLRVKALLVVLEKAKIEKNGDF